jgi:hypothetical protein
VARCFLWGVLAGTGFNLLETFQNSIAVVSPQALADQTLGNAWWLFALARAGTSGMHGLASGLSAIGFYGLLRNRPRYLLGYPCGVALHGTWNFLVYVISGDALFSAQGPDSRLLDLLGAGGLILVFATSVMLLWVLPTRLKDDHPAPVYVALRLRPQAAVQPQMEPRITGHKTP